MLTLPREDRMALWKRLVDEIEVYIDTLEDMPVAPVVDVDALRARLASIDFTTSLPPLDAVAFVTDGLWGAQVHTAHPRYYGLFNPNPATMGIAADTLAAAFNPQLAAWSHNPFACEVERHLVTALGERFGYPRESVGGSFTSGGAEANHTALLAALHRRFEDFGRVGARTLPRQPVFYVSGESHHSFLKAAGLCGIGTEAARIVPVDGAWRMDVNALAELVRRDRADGHEPFMVVATLGTTGAGTIDDLTAIAAVTDAENLWLHADAAWGGAAALAPELRAHLGPIERSDSITFDAHKWMSVPMGAGMIFTRHPEVLEQTFAVDTGYMPLSDGRDVIEPHRTSMQWSRRFIGLKVFMSLLVAGWDGYAEAIRHQTRVGDMLRVRLEQNGWRVVNDTPLPTVCFIDGDDPGGHAGRTDPAGAARLDAICNLVVESGRAWISTTVLGGDTKVLRATITNFATQPSHVDLLVKDLDWAREEVS